MPASAKHSWEQRLNAVCCDQVFIHRLRKYVGAYLLQLGQVDAFVWCVLNPRSMHERLRSGIEARGLAFLLEPGKTGPCPGKLGSVVHRLL